jgi:hypothetical protein
MVKEDWRMHQCTSLQNVSKELKGGVCAALSYDWIRVTSTGMDYAPNLYGGIAQHVMSMYRGANAYIECGKPWQNAYSQTAKKDGFISINWMHFQASAPSDLLQFTLWDHANTQVDINQAQYIHFSIQGPGGGHSVAFKLDAAPYLFFDPNFGQFSDDSKVSMGVWINGFLAQNYPTLQASGWSAGLKGQANKAFHRPQ